MANILKKVQDKGALTTLNKILPLLKTLMKGDSENLSKIQKALEEKDYNTAIILIQEELGNHDGSKTVEQIKEMVSAAKRLLLPKGDKPQQPYK